MELFNRFVEWISGWNNSPLSSEVIAIGYLIGALAMFAIYLSVLRSEFSQSTKSLPVKIFILTWCGIKPVLFVVVGPIFFWAALFMGTMFALGALIGE